MCPIHPDKSFRRATSWCLWCSTQSSSTCPSSLNWKRPAQYLKGPSQIGIIFNWIERKLNLPLFHNDVTLLRSIFKCLKTAVSRAGPVVQMSTRRFNWRRARFEQTVGTMSILYIFTGTVFDAIVFCIKRSLMTMTIRKTRRYLNIYMLWLSTIFNIILPIVSLALLNTFITRWTLFG